MKKAINIFIYIFGIAVVSAASTVIICLAAAMDKTPHGGTSYDKYWQKFENHYYLADSDFASASVIGACIGGAWILINLVLIFTGGFDSNYYTSVLETLKVPFVRFFGVLVLSGTFGGAFFFFMEYITATEKYPPKYDEWYQFAVVFALLGIIIYYLVRLVMRLFRKKPQGSVPAA